MRLKIFESRLLQKPDAIIGKTGVIRLRKNTIHKDIAEKNVYWNIAINEEEKIIKNIYFIKSKQKINFYKFQLLNGRISLNIKDILEEANIKYPCSGNFSPFKSPGYDGFVFTILEPS